MPTGRRRSKLLEGHLGGTSKSLFEISVSHDLLHWIMLSYTYSIPQIFACGLPARACALVVGECELRSTSAYSVTSRFQRSAPIAL